MNDPDNPFSKTIHRIAVASIALGLALMLISFLILGGFKQTIQNKIYDVSGHLLVTKYTMSASLEEVPISSKSEFIRTWDSLYTFIDHVQAYAHKAALLKINDEVEGIMLKGVEAEYDWDRLEKKITRGRKIAYPSDGYSMEILVSERLSRKLGLNLEDEVIAYFVQDPPRFRKLKVVGVYDTELEDFDEKIIWGDLGLIQRLNNWGDSLIGGYEVFLKDLRMADYAEEKLFNEIDADLYVEKVSERYIQIFDWLELLNQNVLIFLGFILFVACFNMISILLILIMERTQMIGLLKAIGSTDRQIRKIFANNGRLLLYRGMLIGNGIGLGFGFVQWYFHLIPLDPENYYMSFVPVLWDWGIILGLNLMIFLMVNFTLFIPTMIISKIRPVKALKFD